LQEEKRRLRLIHVLRNSTEQQVNDIRKKIPSSYSYEQFAELVARGYRLISEEIHTLSYGISFDGEYCPKITAYKTVNECLNVIMEQIEFDVGEMIPRKKQKLDDEGTSS